MDDPTETAFLRIQGQISASQTMLAHLIKSSPQSLDAAKAAVESIAKLSEFLENHEDQKMQIVSLGMREFLSGLTDALDT
ncbi:hypothetical protein [Stenotrophomonas rhizophila]|uniref:hypothetical protein n=1 Tax=Stenotrophomonas rhizophila TaxID=216778 RepID=UPI0028AF23A4|nr:hypothetical protein [Stenotrophomonas rhizophila]